MEPNAQLLPQRMTFFFEGHIHRVDNHNIIHHMIWVPIPAERDRIIRPIMLEAAARGADQRVPPRPRTPSVEIMDHVRQPPRRRRSNSVDLIGERRRNSWSRERRRSPDRRNRSPHRRRRDYRRGRDYSEERRDRRRRHSSSSSEEERNYWRRLLRSPPRRHRLRNQQRRRYESPEERRGHRPILPHHRHYSSSSSEEERRDRYFPRRHQRSRCRSPQNRRRSPASLERAYNRPDRRRSPNFPLHLQYPAVLEREQRRNEFNLHREVPLQDGAPDRRPGERELRQDGSPSPPLPRSPTPQEQMAVDPRPEQVQSPLRVMEQVAEDDAPEPQHELEQRHQVAIAKRSHTPQGEQPQPMPPVAEEPVAAQVLELRRGIKEEVEEIFLLKEEELEPPHEIDEQVPPQQVPEEVERAPQEQPAAEEPGAPRRYNLRGRRSAEEPQRAENEEEGRLASPPPKRGRGRPKLHH